MRFLVIIFIITLKCSAVFATSSLEESFFQSKLEFCAGVQKPYTESIQNLNSADGNLRVEALCSLSHSKIAEQLLPNFTLSFKNDPLLEVQEMAIVAMSVVGDKKSLYFFIQKLKESSFLKDKLLVSLATNPMQAYSFLETLSYGMSSFLEKGSVYPFLENLNSEIPSIRWTVLKTLDLIFQKRVSNPAIKQMFSASDLEWIQTKVSFLIRTDLASNVCGTGVKVLAAIGGQRAFMFFQEMLSDKVFSSCIWMKTKRIDLLEVLEKPVFPSLAEADKKIGKRWLTHWYEEFFLKTKDSSRDALQEKEEIFKIIDRIERS